MPNLKASLLIVDDDHAITTTLSHIFRGFGHQVRTAEDGFSALQQIRNEVPDILVCDLNMPRMSGFELLSVIRRRLPEVFVIASSAAFSGEEVPAGIAADAFHEKSTGLERLFDLVKTATHKGHVRSGWAISAPIWISRTKDGSSFERFSIACPECLRSCSLSVGSVNFSIEAADCEHCHANIRYGVVPRMIPEASYAFSGDRTDAIRVGSA
jgi:CheY-like chemotaxis protein